MTKSGLPSPHMRPAEDFILTDEDEKELMFVFKSFDDNGDGTIDAAELAAALRKLGEPHDKAAVLTLINEVDTDKSGRIDPEEFKAAVISLRQKNSVSGFGRVYQKQEFVSKNDALRWACKSGNLKDVMELIKKGADITNATSYGNTALHLAAMEGRLEVVKHLVGTGKAIKCSALTNRGETPLHYAAMWGKTDVCKCLVDFGKCDKDLFLEDLTGYTPLDHAKFRQHEETLEYLLKSAIHFAGRDSVDGRRQRYRRGSVSEE